MSFREPVSYFFIFTESGELAKKYNQVKECLSFACYLPYNLQYCILWLYSNISQCTIHSTFIRYWTLSNVFLLLLLLLLLLLILMLLLLLLHLHLHLLLFLLLLLPLLLLLLLLQLLLLLPEWHICENERIRFVDLHTLTITHDQNHKRICFQSISHDSRKICFIITSRYLHFITPIWAPASGHEHV